EFSHINQNLQSEIKERLKFEEQMRAATRNAESANKAKSEFLANMSHELRTPLNSIIGYSEMLEVVTKRAGHDDYQSDLHRIRTSGEHLLKLINNILDLSKVEAGRMDMVYETIDILSLVDELQATIQPLATNENNTFETRVPKEIGQMQADVTRVRQIIFNLLSNSCKFTTDGVITLEAVREKAGQDDWIIFKIIDTGIGMTVDQQKKVFDEFTQADQSTTKKFGGTGLGLTIVKKMCEMMGGSIELTSELGKGSTFTVWLPSEGLEGSPKEELEFKPSGGGAGKSSVGFAADALDPDAAREARCCV
ncbi:MAG: HAMP domain-containing sensor histidine kinase, partial [Verrucomicrobiota bacterium]